MIEIYLKNSDASGIGLSAQAHRLLCELMRARGYTDMPKIIKNTYGKPYFENNELYFSISHTRGAIAIGLSEREIGIDLQEIRKISPAVMRRYLHSDASDPRECTRLWAEYEAYGKYLGCGIPIPDGSAAKHTTASYDIDGYVLSVCSAAADEIVIYDSEALQKSNLQ